MNGIQEVSGSIPLISTIQSREEQKTVETTRFQRFFCCLQHTAKQDFLRVLVRLIFDQKILNQGDRKMKKIKMNQAATMEETFKDFLTSRKIKGVAEKTLETYSSHLHAVSKHLDIQKDIADLNKRGEEKISIHLFRHTFAQKYPMTKHGEHDRKRRKRRKTACNRR